MKKMKRSSHKKPMRSRSRGRSMKRRSVRSPQTGTRNFVTGGHYY